MNKKLVYILTFMVVFHNYAADDTTKYLGELIGNEDLVHRVLCRGRKPYVKEQYPEFFIGNHQLTGSQARAATAAQGYYKKKEPKKPVVSIGTTILTGEDTETAKILARLRVITPPPSPVKEEEEKH